MLGERPDDRPGMNVILRTDDGLMSLMVDEIGDVLELNTEGYERPPDMLEGMIRECISGVYKLPTRLMLVLNSARVTSELTA